MKVGKNDIVVVIGPRTVRKRQEITLFVNLPHFETKFVTSSRLWNVTEGSCSYKYVKMREILPDPISNIITRQPISATSFIKLDSVGECVNGERIVSCVELYSNITKQFASLKKEKGYRLVVSTFETFTALPLTYLPPYAFNVKKVSETADFFIGYTKKAVSYLHSLSIPTDRISLIYPGIDLKRFSPRKGKHNTFRILFVGGFNKEKGLRFLLKAFARLYKENYNVELWICTSHLTGELKPLAYTYARKYPVRMLGYVDYKGMPEVYKSCDVFCHSSFDRRKWGIKVWEEQFGFSLVEAMACGLPIIATDCGAMPEVVGPRNIIVPQKSVDTLYLALKMLIEDVGYREHLAEANRQRAEEMFDIRKQRTRLDNVLCKLL